MEEDIRKQGMLYLQQQRFGKVPAAVLIPRLTVLTQQDSLCNTTATPDTPSVRDFRVCVRRTEASDRCRLKGDAVLRADGDALRLLDRTGDFLYTWPYRYLRRFGRDKSTFSFEAGRRCESGEGSFEFDTKQGNLLFQAVEAAINLQKVSAPLRQTSGGGQAAGGVYSLVTEPPNLHTVHHKDKESGGAAAQQQQPQRPPLSRLEPPVDKALTGVKSLTLDTRGAAAPRKNQVKMISSCPLPHESGSAPKPGPAPNQDQTYSRITLSAERQSRREKRSGSVAPPCTPPLLTKEPEYSLPFDTIASSVMADLLDQQPPGGRESGADPLYDSIDEMKIRNVFEAVKVEHIYDEPEGCAAGGGQIQPGSVYDDPEEMRGDAWRIMGTPADPKGHEYPYNPRVDDYAVPKRPQRAFSAVQSTSEEEQEQGAEPEEEQREELQDSPYTNVMVKM
ncbi:docking protein 2 [Stegastes partitus]|uniref:Docking protein 2 n=1 Tax=Stegastes partitus TaxID=144197 RepID=A0A9Y4TZD1_9TELE|nr:PREDICTED: docking protein 2-like [Stegastes partitus]